MPYPWHRISPDSNPSFLRNGRDPHASLASWILPYLTDTGYCSSFRRRRRRKRMEDVKKRIFQVSSTCAHQKKADAAVCSVQCCRARPGSRIKIQKPALLHARTGNSTAVMYITWQSTTLFSLKDPTDIFRTQERGISRSECDSLGHKSAPNLQKISKYPKN